MKIQIVIESLCTGGAEGQAALSAVELAKRGHTVEIVTYYPGNDYVEFLANHDISVVPINQSGFLRLKRIRALARELRRFDPDVVHGFCIASGRYAQVAGRLAGVRCIFSGCRDTSISPGYSRWSGWWLTRGRSAGWIANSTCVKQATMKNFRVPSEKVHVVPNGVPQSRVASDLSTSDARALWGIVPDVPVVSMVANLRIEKNHPMLLRVARHVIARYPSAVFLVAGSGPQQELVEQWIAEYRLGDHVRLLGRCANVPDLFRATDVAVLTSAREGLPNTLIEASAAGVPCVSTDNGGASDVIVDGETGYLVPLDDDEAMARRVLELLDNQSQRDTMGLSAARYAQDTFSPDAMVEKLLTAYEAGLAATSKR